MLLSPCMNVRKHHRVWNLGFIPGHSQSISLQSVDLSPFFLAFFPPYIRSKPTGGRLLYRSHGNWPQKASSVAEKKKNKPLLTFRRAAPWMSVGGFLFFFFKLRMTSEWLRTQWTPPSPRQSRWATSIPLKARPQMGWCRRGRVARTAGSGHGPGTEEQGHLPVRTAPFQNHPPSPPPPMALQYPHHRWTAFRKALVMPGLHRSDTSRAVQSGFH